MAQDTSTQPNQSKGRRTLLLLTALFALPIVAVLAMYYLGWSPGGASHGELLRPPQPLRLTELHDLQGKPFHVEQWKDKWNMVYIDGAGCAADCRAQLHLLRQIHASLNKEIGRVQRVLLLPAGVHAAALADVQRQYPDLVILAGADTATLAQQFDASSQPAAGAGHVYLVDPLGNLVMRYPGGYDPKGLRRDLSRLLQYSWAG